MKNKDEKLKRYIASEVLPSGEIIELIYKDKYRETQLAVFDSHGIKYLDKLERPNEVLLPYPASNHLIAKKVIKFASEAEDYGSDEALLKEIQSFIHRYLDISPLFERIASYYVLFTWVFDRFNELAYIRALGDYGSGKSRFLQVIGSLCYKPMFVGGATTTSPIFRIIDSFRGTLILDEVKNKQIAPAEIVFDYSNHSAIISVLEPLVGKGGILKVSNYTVEAFEAEDAVVVSAIDDTGQSIETSIIKKLFSLSAQSAIPKTFSPEDYKKLEELEQQIISVISQQIMERNGEFFDDEVGKLDNWSDDVKKALELDLRKLDIDIKTDKTNAKKIVNLDEKLKAQREIKDSEKKRNEMRRKLYEAQDEVESKKERLIDQVEAQLKQKSKLEPLFSIGWRII